jgi:putative ribosome biogenesis GTPase RsgA
MQELPWSICLSTYDKWKSENNITDEQMTKLAEADYNIYVSKTEKNKEKASEALEKAVAIL